MNPRNDALQVIRSALDIASMQTDDDEADADATEAIGAASEALTAALRFHGVAYCNAADETGTRWCVDIDDASDGVAIFLTAWQVVNGRLGGALGGYADPVAQHGPLDADQALAVAQRLVCWAKYGTTEEVEAAVGWAEAGNRAVALGGA